LGNLDALGGIKVALFCSVRCPGDGILAAYDSARRLRSQEATVISGFHSPVEKECLRVLLRGRQSVIICPARALDGMRIPKEWRMPLEQGRLLLLSPFENSPRRPTVETARKRNDMVAALADEALIIHVTPGGETERVAQLLNRWGVARVEIDKQWTDRANPD